MVDPQKDKTTSQKQKEFGKLIKALRHERTGSIGVNFLSQGRFAETLNIPEVKYGRFERGERKPTLEELVTIAKGLKLTSRERQEFITAGLVADDKTFNANMAEPKDVLNDLIRKLSEVRLPVLVIDNFSTILAVNNAMMHFFSSDESYYDRAKQDPVYANMLEVLFSDHVGEARVTLEDDLDDFLMRNVRFFRGMTFRYRYMPFYDKIIKHLKQYKRFEEYWNRTLHITNDDYDGIRESRINHPFMGDIHFLRVAPVTNTSAGSIFTLMFLPANDITSEKFKHLKQSDHLIRVTQNWPEYMEL